MATYWKSIVFQDDSYVLQEILAASDWEQSSLDVIGVNNSGLAIIPWTADENSTSVFYDRNDNKLFNLQGNQSVSRWVPGKCIPVTLNR
jgi:hypothetical protein